MLTPISRYLVVFACVLGVMSVNTPAGAADLTAENVLRSIDRANKFLIGAQNGDGSWSASGALPWMNVGVSSLSLLALINGGVKVDHPSIQKGLNYLRKGQDAREPGPNKTYVVSLMIMALAAAKDGERDKARIATLAERLERGQIARAREGDDTSGLWSYSVADEISDIGHGDRSNGQFAILGLRAAADAGIPIRRKTWERAHRHWISHQNPDGGWGYSGPPGQSSTGSMTVAGISSLVITSAMLREHKDTNADGTPNCCPEYETNEPLERAIRWMGSKFTVRNNPGHRTAWLLYYLYGMERAGRLSGRRFFGNHDWYREGAKYLIDHQSRRFGSWQGAGIEKDPIVGTSFALLFLAKGLAPVLINKLKFGPSDPRGRGEILSTDWNNHRYDIQNLTQHISGLRKWPKQVNWQVVDIEQVARHGGVQDLMQSPILFLSGQEQPRFTEKQIELLKEYINQGGFIFAVANCQRADFDDGFRKLIRKMFPDGEAELKKLPPEHPVFRSEHPLEADLWGVDFGCRTAIIYSPDDLSCLWDKWSRQRVPNRPDGLKSRIAKSMSVGVNVVAYATGRELPTPLDKQVLAVQDGRQDKITRGLLQIAKLRHAGGWDAAPQALRNLLLALNRTVGLTASTKQKNLPPTDPNIFRYPIVYMHGRNRFEFGGPERKQVKQYLENGGVLFADACCGAWQFDQSFRKLMEQMFPGKKFKRIPADHEMFTANIGYDIRRVKRRTPQSKNPKVALNTAIREGEPELEGIEIDGRYAVIYSRYDISCALERQASVACSGYIEEDALKIAINVVLYAMLQDVRYADAVR